MIEIFDAGRLFSEIEDRKELVLGIKSGKLIPKPPKRCPPSVSKILTEMCFKVDHSQRSTMNEVCKAVALIPSFSSTLNLRQ